MVNVKTGIFKDLIVLFMNFGFYYLFFEKSFQIYLLGIHKSDSKRVCDQ